jgi:hypothetical protein
MIHLYGKEFEYSLQANKFKAEFIFDMISDKRFFAERKKVAQASCLCLIVRRPGEEGSSTGILPVSWASRPSPQ